MNKDQIINTVKVVTLALVLGIGIQYAAAQAVTTWTPPDTSPPDHNTAAPLNVGTSGQSKAGGLILGGGLSPADNGLVIFNGKFNLGAGNTTGNSDATIQAAGTNAARLFLTTGSGSGQTWHMQNYQNMFQVVQSGVATRLAIDSSGRIGIGASAAPDSAVTLNVNGNMKVAGDGTSGDTPAVNKVLGTVGSAGYVKWKTPTISYTSCSWVRPLETPYETGGSLGTNLSSLPAGFTAMCSANQVVKDLSYRDNYNGSGNTVYFVECCTPTITLQ